MKQNKVTMWITGILSILVLVLLDQYTKGLSVKYLKDQADIPIIKDVFELAYVENRGAAFGMMQNKQTFFIITTILVLGLILWIFHTMPMEKKFLPGRITLVFIIAGAVGNFIDRVSQGFVVDFLYFKLIDFPVFNVADIYVTCAVFVLAFLLLIYYKEEDIDRIMKMGRK
ncbi:MAG: signal peptidase II [Lachnospiraceae bacterium]|nr:signal peptidase II [Lachnospiraceae bacterium]